MHVYCLRRIDTGVYDIYQLYTALMVDIHRIAFKIARKGGQGDRCVNTYVLFNGMNEIRVKHSKVQG
jgi:hypothetical protein